MKKTLLFICLISIFFLVGCEQVSCPDSEECAVCPEEKALLSIYFDGWGENINNTNQVIFGVTIMNFGYREAKNVEVDCSISDREGKKIFSKTKNIGNIASTSTIYKDIILPRDSLILTKGILGMCFITGCDDCEILEKRLPEIVDLFYD